MNSSCPQQCGLNDKISIGGVKRLEFQGKFTIERTDCGIIICIAKQFYDREIRQYFPEEATKNIRLFELNDCNRLEPPARLVFLQLRRSLDAGISSEMYYACKALELLFLINNESLTTKRRNSELPYDDRKAVNAIREIIEARFQDCPKIAELAVMTNTSPAKLQRDFKNAFGRTIHDYLLETRMARAVELLEESDKPIGMIAKDVGCMKAGRFSEIFKATFGLTPRDYRGKKNGEVIIQIGELS